MAEQLSSNFDEASGNVLDYSGNNRHWALTNGLQRTAGKTGNGLTKNGGAGSMGLIADPSFLSAASWTIAFWQRNPGNGVWWFRLYNVGLDSGSGILNVAGTLRLRIKSAAGANAEVPTTPPSTDDEWHHYAGTYDGDVGRFYIDGGLIGTTSSVPSPAAIDRIDIAEHTVTSFTMDDVWIFDTALNQVEINELKNRVPGSTPELFGSVALGTTINLSVSGVKSTSATEQFGTGVALAVSGSPNKAGSITLTVHLNLIVASDVNAEPAPPERTYRVPASPRTRTILAENRTVLA